MTYYCPDCVVEWYPYMCPQGVCEQCGGGTRRHNRGHATPGVVELHKQAREQRERLDRADRFELYYEAREVAALLAELDAWGVAP